MPIFIETIDKGWVNLQHVAVALSRSDGQYHLLAVDGTLLGMVTAAAFLDAAAALELAISKGV